MVKLSHRIDLKGKPVKNLMIIVETICCVFQSGMIIPIATARLDRNSQMARAQHTYRVHKTEPGMATDCSKDTGNR
jgi:hypothetical protein